ncbi:hypothetical protein DTW90_34115 [Neorhizobium sp. P12A]|nr:hypothetical protein DTW90_34115 [Neorhizobium sp. P12A]
MSAVMGKLGFILRELWHRDWLFRTSVFVGPAPLTGLMVAGGVWWYTVASPGTAVSHAAPPPWAAAVAHGDLWDTSAEPQAVKPAHSLPPVGADGLFVGAKQGWQVVVNAVHVDVMLQVKVDPTPLTGFTAEGPGIEMDRVLASQPGAPIYAAKGLGYIAVRTAGIHTISLRLERPAGHAANCIAGLGFAGHKVYSNVALNLVSDVSQTYPPARFDLEPGLYPLEWVFGCWHDQAETGPGKITLLIQHPGEDSLQPARDDEIIHSLRASP